MSAPATAEPAAWRSRVEELLARGKTRDAVELAKRFHKDTRSLEAEALLVDAYDARIRALMAAGLVREARELATLVADRWPGTRARIMPLIRGSAAPADGDLGPLLTALAAADPATRRDHESTLRRVLIDPGALADHPALSTDDPLRQAARAVHELFRAVTTGPLPEGALAPLDVIPRSSPLAPWKLLIRAIDAYYRGADAAVLANLSGIPPDSAPARLGPALRCLAGDASGAERRSLAERVLLDRVSGGRARFGAALGEVIGALRVKDQRRVEYAVRDLAEAADGAPRAFRMTFAATMLTHWLRLEARPEPLMAGLLRGRRDVDTLRQIALAFERTGLWEAAVPAWDGYLEAAVQTGALPRAGRAPSRVLQHMAELLPPEIDVVLDRLAVEDEAELEQLIRAGVVPECFDRAGLLERARAADPHPEVFRALVAHWEPRDLRRAETEAQAWRARHPRDLEPLLYLARAAEKRGAYRKALDLLGQAEALDRVHAEVRRSRFRVRLSSAERRLREGRGDLARRDLDRLALEPEALAGDRPAYLGALRWAAARRDGDPAAVAALEGELVARLANPVLVRILLANVTAQVELGEVSWAEATFDAPRLQAIEGLARAADLLFGLGRSVHVPLTLIERVELNPRGAPAGHLHSLCVLGRHLNRPTLVYAAAGAGLELDSGLTHRFLLARGRALLATPRVRAHPRARRCLQAARILAGRVRDTDTVREASAALRGWSPGPPWDAAPDGDELTGEEIRQLIADERGRPAMPGFEAAPGRRRPGRRAPRRPLAQQQLLDFLRERP